MSEQLNLTDVTPLRPWYSSAFDVYQGTTDYVDFRFTLPDGTKRSALRLLGNRDVRLYGELIMEQGAFRSASPFSFTSYSSAPILAAFRQGNGIGSEKLLIRDEGLSANVKAASGLNLRLEWARLDFYTLEGAADDRWGFASTDSSGVRTLAAQNSAGTVKSLEIQGSTVKFRGTSATLAELMHLAIWAGSAKPTLVVPDTLQILAWSGGTTWHDIVIYACDIYLALACDDSLKVVDTNKNLRMSVNTSAKASLISPSTANAELELDSTATSGAKKWAVRSDRTAKSLKFVNTTDAGTPTVEIDEKGSVYAAEFVGTKAVTGAPADADGRVGAHVIDTTNNRIWVKVTDSGSNRWRYATLTSV